MQDTTRNGQNLARLLPIVMPKLGVPSLGHWRSRGACAGEDPEMFFPSHGDPGAEAREVCSRCPVRRDCLDYAMEVDEFGIWGGLDQRERRARRRRHERQVARSAS
jgi:WhiB family transcriptional regulator, redox-sensing transcriptional regulator